MTIRVKLHEAIVFATERHAGQKRKGSDIDYICHPLEVAMLLTEMRPDNEELIIAGVLHDLVEDNRAEMEEIVTRFGSKVSELVAAHTHSKEGTWRERKQRATEQVASASEEVKLLVLADKVSNLRSMYADYLVVGEKLWDRFNAGKDDQRWFYASGFEIMDHFQYDETTKDVYWEGVDLFNAIFNEDSTD